MAARPRWIVALAVAALVAVPATAQATLTFVRNPFSPAVWTAADDGSGARRVAAGSNPRVSPDGEIIAFLVYGGGRPRILVRNALEPDWSR